MNSRSRRAVLKLAATGIAAGLAGCNNSETGETDTRPGAGRTTGAGTGDAGAGTDGGTPTASPAELRQRIADLNGRLEALNRSVSDRDERIETLESDLSAARDELDDRAATVTALESTVAERDETIAALEAEIDRLDGRIETLESEVGDGTGDSAFSDEELTAARETIRQARQSVVFVDTGGTGWVIDAEAGYIVTNAHVVDGPDPDEFNVETFDGETQVAERIDYEADLAPDVGLLQADLDVPALPTGQRTTVETEDPLVTIGHPGRVGKWVATIGRFKEYRSGLDWMLSTVPTVPGNSGGPLLTLDGRVVGLVSGSTTVESDSEDYSKSTDVFEEMPSAEQRTTANPIETVESSVDEWT